LANFDVTSNGLLTSTVVKNNYPDMGQKQLTNIRLLGQGGNVSSVNVNGEAHTSFSNLPSGEVLISNLALNASAPFIVRWT